MKKKHRHPRPKMTKEQLITHLLDDPEVPVHSEEELMNLLVEAQISYDTESNDNLTFGQRMADKLAEFAGSWGFIFTFMFLMFVWILINLYLLSKPWDPFPFILLNLCLSCLAALQAPIIMMSQNRQEEKDRIRGIQDYEVNLKTEFMLESLYKNLNQTVNKLTKLEAKIEKLTMEVEQTQDLTELLSKTQSK